VIPLGDSVAANRRPFVTLGVIVACAAVFVYELTLSEPALDRLVQQWGVIPRDLWAMPRSEWPTLFTSQFIHAGVLHLAGNMVFLWVFGRAVEDRLGHPLFFAFYGLAGVAAAVVQSLISGPAESVPMIGASGAIAGVLGMYFLSYPGAWVRVLAPVLFFFWTFDLPAVLVLAVWFGIQFFSGVGAITATSGVAFWAHVAGFLFGVGMARLLPHSATPTRQTPDAPGPARLVSSVADLLALLLTARLLILFFGLTRSPLGALATPVLAVTNPLVQPLQSVMPAVRLAGGLVETYTLVAILGVYLVAGMVAQVLVKR
jgi:membrane associated rhomboid family serine protease